MALRALEALMRPLQFEPRRGMIIRTHISPLSRRVAGFATNPCVVRIRVARIAGLSRKMELPRRGGRRFHGRWNQCRLLKRLVTVAAACGGMLSCERKVCSGMPEHGERCLPKSGWRVAQVALVCVGPGCKLAAVRVGVTG
jgi:hypothetical protein